MSDEKQPTMALTRLIPICPKCFALIDAHFTSGMDVLEPQPVGCVQCDWTGYARFADATRSKDTDA